MTVFAVIIGALGSWCKITFRPFSNVYEIVFDMIGLDNSIKDIKKTFIDFMLFNMVF